MLELANTSSFMKAIILLLKLHQIICFPEFGKGLMVTQPVPLRAFGYMYIRQR